MKNKKLSGFFINLLGVILGISLTFGVNSLWQKREENKRTKEMLILIRNELKDTKVWFKDQEETMKNDGYVYEKILKAKKNLKSIPADTLSAYHNQIYRLTRNPYTTSAWQIFQNSEMIQKMSNKELVIRLAACYSMIDLLHDFIMNDYWEIKMKLLSSSNHDDSFRFFDTVLKNNEYVFFFNMFRSDQSSIWNAFPILEAFIDYTILLLDKHGDYRYDMDEKDQELGSFVKARLDSLFPKNDTIEITKTISDEK